MSIFDEISFALRLKLPIILQTEGSECGLACLGMVAAYHGFRSDLASLRRRFPISLKGITLTHLMHISHQMNLATRPVTLELENIRKLRMPCILHWEFNHFVVLKEATINTVTIHDPAVGLRKMPISKISKSFTGVALELWPNPGFQQQNPPRMVKFRELMGHVTGLRRSFGQILLLAFALEILTIVNPFFLQWVIDNVVVTADRDLLTTLALGFGLLMLMQQIVILLRSWAIIFVGTTLNLQWRANVFTHLVRLPVQYFEKRHLGDIVSRFGVVDTIQSTLTTTFLTAILDGVMAALILILMFIYSSTLAWLPVTAMVIYALTRTAWYQPLRNATAEQIIHTAKQQSHFLETVRGVKAIKLFHHENERRTHWLSLFANQINASLHTQKLTLFYQTINGILFGLENILIVWLGTVMVINGTFTVGVLMAFIAYKTQFDTRVSSLIDNYFSAKMLQLQGERLADIVLTEPETAHDSVIAPMPDDLEPSIEVQGLRYRYAENEPYVLNDINLHISGGESVAIIGSSGCGKTTLLNVLLGILPFSEGIVRVGGVDINKLGVGNLRRMVGTVMQDDVLFAGSIADNISFFDPHADQEWINECARLASIHKEITVMPMGYETLVGDMGTVLSGGQKQRILLARALYKKPKILFLDEATSHLDVRREQKVNVAVQSLRLTRVIIAHRAETIASADRIIEIRKGITSCVIASNLTSP